MELQEFSDLEASVSRRTSLTLMLVGAVGLATGHSINRVLAAEKKSGIVITLTDANWSAEVLQSKIPVLVDFSARWCGPCQQMKPTCKKIAKEYRDRVKVGELDIDDNEIDSTYDVELFPTFIVFRNGEEVDRRVGLQTEDELRAMLDLALRGK